MKPLYGYEMNDRIAIRLPPRPPIYHTAWRPGFAMTNVKKPATSKSKISLPPIEPRLRIFYNGIASIQDFSW